MTTIADEYASALFSIACESADAQKIKNSLSIMSSAFDSEPEYMLLLTSPAVSVKERVGLLQAAFGDTVDEYALSCVSLMCEHGVIDKYSEMAAAYCKLLDNFTRSTTAYVISAVPLTESEKERLRSGLSAKFGKDIKFECRIDKELIGGIVVNMDGRIIDGSIRSRLDRAKEAIDI